jgi:hypothetical protein
MIVPPKPDAQLAVPQGKPGSKQYKAEIQGNQEKLQQRDEDWSGMQAQSPAWLTGADVGPSGTSDPNWAAFNKLDQAPVRDAYSVPAAS